MAQLSKPFDATQVEPSQPLSPFPAGDYPMIISDSEMKTTKDGNGQYLQLVCEVIDGQFKGRKVWERLNLINKNATAVSIAESTLSAMCHAVGVKYVQDSEELHHKPFIGVVKYVPQSGQYEPKNEMKGYKPMGGNTAPATAQQQPAAWQQPAQQAQPTAAAPPANGEASPPWKKAG